MKKSFIFISILILTRCSINAQSSHSKLDTMSITINGEQIILPLPKAGNKITINMEDSESIIQVSVSKISKNRLPSNPLLGDKINKLEKVLPVKHVSWFNEIDFGTVVFVNRKTYTTGGLYDYTIGVSGSVNSGMPGSVRTGVTFIPKQINPGITFGIAIREKRRTLGHTKLKFITGSRFRYSRYTGSGDYKLTELKTSSAGSDSVISTNTGEFKSATNNYQFVFPYLVEAAISKKGNFKMSAGVNLILNIHSTKYRENLRNTNANIFYNNTQVIIIQPMLKATYKASSLYIAYSLGRTRMGYGLNTKIDGNMLYLGLAYKLY